MIKTLTTNKNSLDLQDFLDASGDAAKRTRFLMIILIVIFVLTTAGFLNSIGDSWMASRIKTVGDPNSPYVLAKLGFTPDAKDERYINFHEAVTETYVENALTMRVPFFGVAFDINDLGLLSGLSFITVLSLLIYSLRNEIVSLRLSFKAAKASAVDSPGELEKFYDLLAMRLVFTLPYLEDNEAEKWTSRTSTVTRFIPKLICFLPLIIYLLVAANDYFTLSTGHSINPKRTNYLSLYTLIFCCAISILGFWCIVKLGHIDKIWDDNWRFISAHKNKVPDEKKVEAAVQETPPEEIVDAESENKAAE